jgi:hypothetical protein
MVIVTDRAKETLFEQKRAANLEGAEVALRVAASPSGQWTLVADHARDDDQIVQHRGSTVLLVDLAAQVALDGVRLDSVLTPEGDTALVLVDDLDEAEDIDEDAAH